MEHDESGSEAACCENVASVLVVTVGDSALLVKLVEEVLDQMMWLLQAAVAIARLRAGAVRAHYMDSR